MWPPLAVPSLVSLQDIRDFWFWAVCSRRPQPVVSFCAAFQEDVSLLEVHVWQALRVPALLACVVLPSLPSSTLATIFLPLSCLSSLWKSLLAPPSASTQLRVLRTCASSVFCCGPNRGRAAPAVTQLRCLECSPTAADARAAAASLLSRVLLFYD